MSDFKLLVHGEIILCRIKFEQSPKVKIVEYPGLVDNTIKKIRITESTLTSTAITDGLRVVSSNKIIT